MSDEQRKEDEIEVEGHVRGAVASDGVVGDEDETEDSEVEAHIKFPNVRMD